MAQILIMHVFQLHSATLMVFLVKFIHSNIHVVIYTLVLACGHLYMHTLLSSTDIWTYNRIISLYSRIQLCAKAILANVMGKGRSKEQTR